MTFALSTSTSVWISCCCTLHCTLPTGSSSSCFSISRIILVLVQRQGPLLLHEYEDLAIDRDILKLAHKISVEYTYERPCLAQLSTPPLHFYSTSHPPTFHSLRASKCNCDDRTIRLTDDCSIGGGACFWFLSFNTRRVQQAQRRNGNGRRHIYIRVPSVPSEITPSASSLPPVPPRTPRKSEIESLHPRDQQPYLQHQTVADLLVPLSLFVVATSNPVLASSTSLDSTFSHRRRRSSAASLQNLNTQDANNLSSRGGGSTLAPIPGMSNQWANKSALICEIVLTNMSRHTEPVESINVALTPAFAQRRWGMVQSRTHDPVRGEQWQVQSGYGFASGEWQWQRQRHSSDVGWCEEEEFSSQRRLSIIRNEKQRLLQSTHAQHLE